MIERCEHVSIEPPAAGNLGTDQQRNSGVLRLRFALGLEAERNIVLDSQRKQVVEARDALAGEARVEPGAGIEPAEVGPIDRRHRAATGRSPVEQSVVQHHRHTVAAEPHIGLDHRGTEFDRHAIGCQGLLGRICLVATMRDDQR